MKEFFLLPESLEPSEDSPDCEGDDLTLPRLVRRVNLHLICNTEEYKSSWSGESTFTSSAIQMNTNQPGQLSQPSPHL